MPQCSHTTRRGPHGPGGVAVTFGPGIRLVNLSDVTSWVVGGVVGVALAWSLNAVRTAWQGQRGPLRGVWWEYTPPVNGQPQKLDRVKCRNSGKTVTAHIQRKEPSIEAHRKWYFQGRAEGNLLYGHFFSHDPNEVSYGTMQLHKHDQFGTVWKGTYSRPQLRPEEEGWVEYLPHIPIEWRRKA